MSDKDEFDDMLTIACIGVLVLCGAVILALVEHFR